MKFTFTTITLIIITALVTMGMLVQYGGSTPDCLEVANASVHAYYQPEFEAALVGYFVEGEPLKFKRTEGDWILVSRWVALLRKLSNNSDFEQFFKVGHNQCVPFVRE